MLSVTVWGSSQGTMLYAPQRVPPQGGRPKPYQQLKLLVIQYRFRPHEPLRPTELAPWLNVSVTPVREALTRLHAEGLIMQVPNHGFSAKSLSERETADLFEHAFLLMRHAVEKDIASFTLSGINKPLELEFDADGKAVNITDDLIHSHTKFLEQLYERIVSLARNDAMTAAIRSFNDKTHYVRLLDLETPSHIERIGPGVFDLIDRLVKADVPGAVRALAAQSERLQGVLPALVRDGLTRIYAQAGKQSVD